MIDISIKDASYSIMQGKLNDRVMDIKIYTESLDDETLQKISDVANTSYEFNEKYKSIDCPYVKKLSIK